MSKDHEIYSSEARSSYPKPIIPAFLSPEHILYHANDHIIPYPRYVTDVDSLESQPPIRNLDGFDDIHLSDLIIREKLYDALEKREIDVFMQPIVTLPQRHSMFYELYGRLHIKKGLYISAEQFLPLVHGEAIIHRLDSLLLMRSIRILSQHCKRVNHPVSYFININAQTIRNSIFISNLLGILSHNITIASALIFEIKYNDYLMLSPGEHKILNALNEAGCRFSLDHVEDIPEDIRYLKSRNVHFLKIKAPIITRYYRSEEGFSELLSRKHKLETNNIELIVEKIEDEKTLLQILDMDLKYGQGFLFGKPDFQSVYTR